MANKTQIVEAKSTVQETGLVRTMTPGQMATILLEKQDFDVAKLSALMELQNQHEAKVAKQAFAQALVMFRSKVKPVVMTGHRDDTKARKRDGSFGTVRYDYAELTSTFDQIMPVLEQCQIMPTWRMVKNNESWIELECLLTHVQGHSESSLPLGAPPLDTSGMNPVQKRTATVTMLKRATLFMALGLVTKTDDQDLHGAEQDDDRPPPQAASTSALGDPEEAVKRQFLAACRTKLGDPKLATSIVAKLFAAAQRGCGSPEARKCLEYITKHTTVLSKDGAIAELAESDPPDPDRLPPWDGPKEER